MTPQAVARLLGVSPVTVRQWAQQGWIRAQRTAGQHRRFSMQEVRRFAQERGMQLADRVDRKTRLLIVEDDKQLTDYLSALFEDFRDQLEIRCAYDGFDAGRLTESWRPDILLLDLMLPGIDGFEVCRRLKENPDTTAIRVVAMTGYHSADNVKLALDVGAEYCLAKPFLRAELLEALGIGEPAPGGAGNLEGGDA